MTLLSLNKVYSDPLCFVLNKENGMLSCSPWDDRNNCNLPPQVY